jgi:hypothetical protein
MQVATPSKDARISVETTASANLDEVCRWLIERRSDPLRLEAQDLPALGQDARLVLALPLTARRAVLCAVWVLADGDESPCVLSGQLRFVAHPSSSELMVTFRGRTAMAVTTAVLYRRANHVVGELLQLIAESISRAGLPSRQRQVAI